MFELKVFEGEKELGARTYASIPRIGQSIEVDRGDGTASRCKVVRMSNFPRASEAAGGPPPAAEIWMHVEAEE